jgi:hypothetical protein
VPVKTSLILAVTSCVAASACARPAEAPPDRSADEVLASIPVRSPAPLDAALASRFAALSLGCVDRDWPNKPGHVYDGDGDVRPPREVTPAFAGCFDWHSAVHGHWAMARLLRTFPDLPEGPRIRDVLRRHLEPARIAAEVAFLSAPRSRTFERPYGLAWLLRLATELRSWDDPDSKSASQALAPLERAVAKRLADYLPRLTVPVRDGTHQNTAFAMAHALEWARASGDAGIAATIESRSRDFFGADRDCPTAYEPSGEDFVSPCLAEADLMHRVLPRDEFAAWLAGFLPPAGSPRFRPLLAPVEVRDRHDPRIGHLIGLAFHRAWTMRGVAGALAEDDPTGALLLRLADLHQDEGLKQMFDSGYGGEHWLASFAVYAMTR